MGDVLDYERGRLGIGRFVRVIGHRSGSHATGAKLTGAERWRGVVRLFGHGHDERIDWKFIQDWPSKNGGPWPEPPPAPMPVIRRVPEPTALEARELKAQPMHRHQIAPATSPVIDAAAAASIKAALAESEVMDLGDLGARIRQATTDLEAASGILRDMQAEHARQVAAAEDEIRAKQDTLREVRDQAKRALEMADAALGGGAA